MARSATRAARRKQEREERRRSQRALRPAGQPLAHKGAVYWIPARPDPTACAIHEAGHCLVAHAVGMHVIYATVKREIVLPGRICRKGHPGEHVNTTDTPFVSDGFNVAEPLLAAEVEERLIAGLPLTPEHRLWLAQSALSSAAGPLAEIGAGLGDGGARSDLEQVSYFLNLLARSLMDSGEIADGKAWYESALHSILDGARIILNQNLAHVGAFADQLIANLELDTDSCQGALSALPCGKCAWMIEEFLCKGTIHGEEVRVDLE